MMLIKSKFIKFLSVLISLFSLSYIVYISYQSFFVVKNQFIDIKSLTYVNQVRVDDYTQKLANHLTKNCNNEICEVQSILDFVTNIPYKVNENIAKGAKQVVEQNFGDCDDKSNLLISLLKAKNYEAYFVLVPKHIFVIVNLKNNLINKKGFYINDQKFYILESTAKDSKIGFPLKYRLEEIVGVIDPFRNKEIDRDLFEYK